MTDRETIQDIYDKLMDQWDLDPEDVKKLLKVLMEDYLSHNLIAQAVEAAPALDFPES